MGQIDKTKKKEMKKQGDTLNANGEEDKGALWTNAQKTFPQCKM